MEQKYLAINLGSQSKKYALASGGEILARAHLEPGVTLTAGQFQAGLPLVLERWRAAGHLGALEEIARVGIRIVSPGTYFATHRVIDADYRSRLGLAAARWPLHLAPAQSELALLAELLPEAELVGLSDSAFHQPLSETARAFAIDPTLAARLDLYRFGYHGLSVGSVVRQLRARGDLPQRLIVAHLGGGVSVTALRAGKTVETSMGFSPLSGLAMSTRAGDLDPGALLHLATQSGLTLTDLARELEEHGGLLALGGSTGEVRDLLAREASGDLQAKLALAVLHGGVLKYFGAYLALQGGADRIVLTGTIAERSVLVVERLRVAIQPIWSGPVELILTDELGEMIKLLYEI